MAPPGIGLQLENPGLRGTKQPRCRLALTLPGADRLGIAKQTGAESCGPENKLLKLSMETKCTMTTNSILTTDSSLTSQSNLSSNHLLTSSPLLSLTSESHLSDKLSTSILPSSLCKSTVMSTNFLTSNKPSDLDTAFSALTSNVSYSPKVTTASYSSAGDYSFSVNPQVEISNLSNSSPHIKALSLTPECRLLPSINLQCDSKINKDMLVLSAVTSSFPPSLTTSLGLGQAKAEDIQSLEDELPEDAILVDSCEGESLSSDVEFPIDNGSSSPTPSAQEKPQTVDEQSEALDDPKSETLLKQKKMALISAVCCSLVNSPNFSNPSDLTRADIQSLCEDIAKMDPEFVLKVALYTRQELNIRSTANFLMAVCALVPACRPHLRRYFCAAVQLPSDWMEVPRLYQSLSGKGDNLASLPSCLRRGLTLKFQEFSEYQLAKYNTRVQRGKRESKKKRIKEPKVTKVSIPLKFGRKLRAFESALKLLQKKPDQADLVSTEKKKKKDKFSLKSLIQRLHICKPAKHVMSLLGCRYPKDLASYSRSGLEGPWQSHLSGQRMKLKQPETWERELSQKGNTSSVWESLLDDHKVPFMALLRNLRNMIRAGIGKRHHKAVNARLTNQHAVIQSRLFPFRFLSAYKVIQDLESQLERAGVPFPSNAVLLQRIFRREGKNIPEMKRITRKRLSRAELRSCLAVPVVHQLLKREKEAIRKARMIKFDEEVLESYKKSLEEAIRISAHYNIPPIAGRTVILMYVGTSMYEACHGAKELAVSTTKDFGGTKPSLMDVGLLLSLMVKETAENAELILFNDRKYALAENSTSPLLERVQEIKEQASNLSEWSPLPFEDRHPAAEYLLEILLKRTKVDTLLVFTSSPPNEEFQSVLKQYRQAVNMECLCVTVVPHGFKSEDSIEQCKDVTLCGFTEQVLKYVSERGTDRLLDHVEKVNERFKVPEDPDKVKRSQASSRGLLTTIPKQRWRSVRVFISSTFRDMHSERDLLIGQVMPQLRLRAAFHFLSLEEVDLRWGITEEETKRDRQLSLCLSEVVRSQIFIGILGERYGHIPKTYSVPHLPEYEWVHTYPAGRSVTELEMMQFLQGCRTQKCGHPKAFFYFRNPEALRCVPSHWLPDFTAESQEAAKRVKELKNKVAKHPAASSYLYSCQWEGEHDGKPHMTALEDFAARVLEDIWQVIERDFIKELDTSDDEDQLAQEAFQEWHEQRSFARSKLVTSVCTQIMEKRRTSSTNGQLFLVVGEPSQGKTVFMADLVKKLSLAPSSSVVYHFTEATARAKEAETMLNNVCKQLNQRLQRRNCNLTSYRLLLAEFQALLQLMSRSLKRNDTLTLLIDGADLLCGHSGELTSDWIPDLLPQRVNLVLSVTEGSSLCSSLRKRKDSVPISLGRLEPSEQTELVRGKLALYGKKLEESAFNNQLRLLMIKKGTRDPLYLTMACEELRASSVFEKLSDDIQRLPATLPPLIQKRLEMLEEEHGVNNVRIALTAICISRKGLWERDLLRILSSLQELGFVQTASWDELLNAVIHSKNLPMATFTLLLTGLKSVLGLWNRNMASEPRLHLSSCLLREAVEKRYFGIPEVVRAVHLLIAAHFWAVSSPENPESSPALHAECLSELSHHLLCGKQFHTLSKLLTCIPFLKAHATLGLLPHLCQVYSSYESAISGDTSSLAVAWDEIESNEISDPPVREFKEFIERSLHILAQNPSQFYQLALNEPDTSPVCIQTQVILADYRSVASELITVWNNKPSSTNVCSSKSLDVPSTPGCVGLSTKGDIAVLGTSNGSLHILYTNSGEEVRTLYSGCDGVSTCAFISDTLLCVGSYDGIIEIWNITDGCRLHRFEAHRRQVTGCCVSADHRQFITCSLDFQLKSWDTSRYSQLSSTSFLSPLNCVAFHPGGHVVAVGSWDGKISVVRLEDWKRSAVMHGSSSVRTVSFSMEGSVVVSGCLDGWVSLWSWEKQVELSRFRAHGGSTMTASFLHHGEYLLTGGEDGKVQVSSGGLGRLHGHISVKNAQSEVLSLALSPNRELLAVGYHSDSVHIISVATGDLVAQCSFTDVAVSSLVWVSDSMLVSGSSDSLIRVWHVAPGQCTCRLTLSAHQRTVMDLAISSKLLASASEDVSICLWPVESLVASDPPVFPVSVLRGHTAAVTCCSFSPDGRLLATGGQDRSVLCWDVSVNPPILLCTLLSCHKDWVTSCSWTDSGMLISGSGDGSVCLWDIQQGKLILTFAGHQSVVSSVACMRERVITTSRDGSIKVWSLTGLEIANIRTDHKQLTHSATCWEPKESRADADIVVYTAGTDGTILKCSPLQMEQIQTLCGHGGAVTTSATNPMHDVSITAAVDGSVRLWGVPCRDESFKASRHKGAVSAMAWSPDGELVVSGGEFGDLIVWKQHKTALTLQCGELCICSVVFTAQRSFCVISNDLSVSRWILLPCKGGTLRAKKAYSVAIESPVLAAVPTSSHQLQLQTLSGKVFLLDIKTGSLRDTNVADALQDPNFKPPQEELRPGCIITASKTDFGVSDSTGALWLQGPQQSDETSSRKWEQIQIHSASVSCLNVMNDLVITASTDRSVKIWRCNPFRQVGIFHCEGAVTCVSPCPLAESDTPSVACRLACGDQYGNVYFLTSLQI